MIVSKGAHNNEDGRRKVQLKKSFFYERSLLHKFIHNTASMGVHRNDTKENKHKFKTKLFSMEDRFG